MLAMRRQIDTHLESTLPLHPLHDALSLAGSAVRGARRITTRHFETAEMAQGGENSRLHHTGVYPEGGCCAARIRPSAWTGARAGEGRGRPRRIGDAEYDSQTVGNWGESCTAALDHGRRSTELRISISPRACWPLPTSSNSIGERPCFWLGRWLDVCSRRCGRQVDSVGGRLVPPSSSWAGAWPISKWYDDTRPWCSVCWAESTNWECIDVSCFATQKKRRS